MVAGAFRPGETGAEWCDAEVLRQIRRASLALAQQAAEPVASEALTTFLPAWQGVNPGGRAGGVDDLYRSIEQLGAATAPASEWERSILPARLPGYQPAWLDELTGSGDVMWFGAGGLPQGDGWIGFVTADQMSTLLPPPVAIDTPTEAQSAVLDLFGDGVALLTRGVHAGLPGYSSDVVDEALWDLVWTGVLTNDSLAAVRTRLGRSHLGRSQRVAPPTSVATSRRRAPGAGRRSPRVRPGEQVPGRWFRVASEPATPTLRAHALAEALLSRHGVLTRGSVATENVSGGFAAVYRVMSAMEDAGRVQRGYFVEGLGAAQFAGSSAVDQIRRRQTAGEPPGSASGPIVLAATDPANPYGAALPWPASADAHRPGRKAGATVVLDDHGLALFVERGGRSLLTWSEAESLRAAAAAEALAGAVRAGRRPPLHVQRVDGTDIHSSGWRHHLQEAGFLLTPRGLRLRPIAAAPLTETDRAGYLGSTTVGHCSSRRQTRGTLLPRRVLHQIPRGPRRTTPAIAEHRRNRGRGCTNRPPPRERWVQWPPGWPRSPAWRGRSGGDQR